MLSKVLAKILTDHGKCKQDSDRYLVPDETSLTLYASVGDETLTLGKLKEVVLDTDVVIAISRDARTIVTYEDVRAVRFSGEKKRGAGLV